MGNANTKEERPRPAERKPKTKTKPAPLVIDPNEMVDGGYLFPQGIYSGSQDFKASVVRQRIIERHMAPFYKGLEDYRPAWTDEQVLEEVEKAGYDATTTAPKAGTPPVNVPGSSRSAVPPSSRTPDPRSLPNPNPRESPMVYRARSNTTSITQQSSKEKTTQTIWLYRSVHECPICFLMYPRLNSTSCCSQEICTECFVQIKRAAPHPPHNQPTNRPPTYELISEPAACPYCQDRTFGIVFEAPPFEWGIAKPASCSTMVVTPDVLRPDWESKLAHARRKVAKRSAAAQALHQNALLPEPGAEPSTESRSSGRRSSRSRMSPSVIEQRMIERAIQQSLRER